MSGETFAIVAAICLVVITAALVAVAVATVRLAAEARRVVGRSDHLLAALGTELPPTVAQARELGANVSRLATELQARLDRVDALLEEADASLVSLRSSLEGVEEVVRGPLDAVDRARRRVGSLGSGLADRVERFRQRVEEEVAEREAHRTE